MDAILPVQLGREVNKSTERVASCALVTHQRYECMCPPRRTPQPSFQSAMSMSSVTASARTNLVLVPAVSSLGIVRNRLGPFKLVEAGRKRDDVTFRGNVASESGASELFSQGVRAWIALRVQTDLSTGPVTW